MKKGKRILAIIGVILLVGLYASTLFFAITDNSATMGMFKASVVCTIMVPIMLYGYTLVYRLIKPKDDDFNLTK